MIKISVAIIAFNEEKKIENCLISVKQIADEIIVVDSMSTDRTKEISLSHGARVIEHKFEGYIEQKNYALSQCQNEYVLSLDADEVLDSELIESIKKVKMAFEADGYSFNRLTNYNGFWVRHCGWYPDVKLRLVKKSAAKWGGVNPHDKLELSSEDSKIIHLKGDLLHYSYDSIEDHIGQTNRFTTIAAKAAFDKGQRSSYFKIITRPILKFLKDYFLKRGFLDGKYGLIICYINSLSAFLKYAKMKDLEKLK